MAIEGASRDDTAQAAPAYKTIAFMADYSEVKFDHVTPDPGKTKIYALHTLFNF